MQGLGRSLVAIALVLLVLGLLLMIGPLLPGLGWLGKLPGDLRIQRPGLRLYLPVTSCTLVSLVLSALLWLLARLR